MVDMVDMCFWDDPGQFFMMIIYLVVVLWYYYIVEEDHGPCRSLAVKNVLWRARACLDVVPWFAYLWTNHAQIFHLLSNICK